MEKADELTLAIKKVLSTIDGATNKPIIQEELRGPVAYMIRDIPALREALEKAEEVDKFISSCSLNPFKGYRTCTGCFFRITCAKKKIGAKDGN